MTHSTRPRILIVDDDEISREILGAALGDGFEVTAVGTSEEGLRVARSSPRPDLILLDVMMPGPGGFATCRELKSSPATADIPLIFVTSMDDHIHEEEGFSAGAADYIGKPFSPPIVRARVNVHLRLKLQNDLLAQLVDRRTEDLQAVQRQARAMLKEYTAQLDAARAAASGFTT